MVIQIKKAQSDIKSVVITLMLALGVAVAMFYMAGTFASDYSVTTSENFTAIQTMSQESLNSDFGQYREALDKELASNDTKPYKVPFLWAKATIEDSMFGKALYAGGLVKDSVGIIDKFVRYTANVLDVPIWIVNFIILVITISIIFTIVYFFRGWQK